MYILAEIHLVTRISLFKSLNCFTLSQLNATHLWLRVVPLVVNLWNKQCHIENCVSILSVVMWCTVQDIFVKDSTWKRHCTSCWFSHRWKIRKSPVRAMCQKSSQSSNKLKCYISQWNRSKTHKHKHRESFGWTWPF